MGNANISPLLQSKTEKDTLLSEKELNSLLQSPKYSFSKLQLVFLPSSPSPQTNSVSSTISNPDFKPVEKIVTKELEDTPEDQIFKIYDPSKFEAVPFRFDPDENLPSWSSQTCLIPLSARALLLQDDVDEPKAMKGSIVQRTQTRANRIGRFARRAMLCCLCCATKKN